MSARQKRLLEQFAGVCVIGVFSAFCAYCPDAQGEGWHFAPPPAMSERFIMFSERGWDFYARESSVLYEVGDPTAEEQYMLELINRARADAWAEAERLKNTTDFEVLDAYSFFNVNLSEMERQFQENLSRTVPPVAMNAKLLTAARLHSQDMYNNVFQGHESSSNAVSPNMPGDTPSERIAHQNYSPSRYGENVFAYARSAFYAHAGFNVDWGYAPYGMQNPPGHREAIHNADYYEVGIGIVTGRNSNAEGSVGPMLVTQDFAAETGGTPFITGVVYADLNTNAFYDIAEGIGSVTVTVAGVSYYAVTPDSGGYAVPVPGNGSYNVSFKGPNVGPYSATATVSENENVKVDYALVNMPLQAPSMVSASKAMFTNSVFVVWDRPDGAEEFALWRGASSNEAVAVLLVETESSSYSDTNVTAGVVYYYRVKAKNESETSVFSAYDSGYSRIEPASIVPVYRLYSHGAAESTYEHLWTISESEKNVLDSWDSWEYEGVAWQSYSSEAPGLVPLYRLYATSVRQHHYTTDTNEYAVLSDEYGEWTGEGVQYFVYSGQMDGTLPVYRFNHPELHMHHFTIDENEKNAIIGNPDWGYDYQGVAFYVLPAGK